MTAKPTTLHMFISKSVQHATYRIECITLVYGILVIRLQFIKCYDLGKKNKGKSCDSSIQEQQRILCVKNNISVQSHKSDCCHHIQEHHFSKVINPQVRPFSNRLQNKKEDISGIHISAHILSLFPHQQLVSQLRFNSFNPTRQTSQVTLGTWHRGH